MRFIIPILLVLISIASFVMFTDPSYKEAKTLQATATQYDQALTNSKKLAEERDTLSQKYNSISPDSLAKLNKLLPDNADNIRLIIDIQRMASSYGMSLSDIKFDATSNTTGANQLAAGTPTDVALASKDYGVFNLSFSTKATYDNFLKFQNDIETSLRLTDIVSIEFGSADPVTGLSTFTVKLKTYWLKG